jgi:hypothetical protein
MSDQSNFKDEEIERERRAATSRRKNLDEERLQIIRDTQEIIRSGTLEQLEEKLELVGKGRNTSEGRTLIQQFICLRGGSRR